MGANERSFSDLFQDIVRDLQEIVRSEVRLAKTEIRDEAVKTKFAILLFLAGGGAAAYGVFFLLLTIVYALSRVIPNWAAALIVGVALATMAGVLLSVGFRRFKQIHPTPERTVETIKENVQWVKQHTK